MSTLSNPTRTAARALTAWLRGGLEASKIVDVLHGRADGGVRLAKDTWDAMQGGWLAYEGGLADGLTRTATFAGLCYELGRIDALRAVIEAGKPAWMDELEVMRPISDANLWFRELSTHYTQWAAFHTSLHSLALRHDLVDRRAAMQLCVEFDPDHIDIDLLRGRHPDGDALWREAVMAERIGIEQFRPRGGVAAATGARRGMEL